jgi:hypothetical protein
MWGIVISSCNEETTLFQIRDLVEESEISCSKNSLHFSSDQLFNGTWILQKAQKDNPIE